MESNKKRLKNSYLYAILDKKILKTDEAVLAAAKKIKNLGVDIIQYRDKISGRQTILRNAYLLKKIFEAKAVLFIVNDYIDIAKIAACDGVHLGQNDASIETARRLLGKEMIIGVSCHNLRQAIDAQKRKAGYISIGPVFKTPLKYGLKPVGLSLIKKLKEKIKIPFFAIGGINEKNISKVRDFGAKRVVVCRPICQSRNLARTINKLRAE